MYIALYAVAAGVELQELDSDGLRLGSPVTVALNELAQTAAKRELEHPRWVWDDTARWYPILLRNDIRIARCVDLRLNHAILRRSQLSAASGLATGAVNSWDRGPSEVLANRKPTVLEKVHTLFELGELGGGLYSRELSDRGAACSPSSETATEDVISEFVLQRRALAGSEQPARLGLLLAAESAGALVAAEMMHAGLPWRSDVHDQILQGVLGDRPPAGKLPVLMEATRARLRQILRAPTLNPDSPSELLKALSIAGLMVTSTRSWQLEKLDHPAIPPLLEYKKMSRLLAASGWNWLDTNVHNGRFHPEYVPGGVVTGRWASAGGGGALQLPKQIRSAVIADPGWKLVVADAAQLEPRILAALAGDRAMAEAGAAGDLYAGIVASGAVQTRDQAKVAMLGAMYGATSGESGRLMPKLRRAFPRAIQLVEDAARAGERGEVVTTRLGRSSPLPGYDWLLQQSRAYSEDATEADASRARGAARSAGRFTRNFIVQGSAAEWALCWMANLRRELFDFSGGKALLSSPHLVFFMHDEVVVHTPDHSAEEVRQIIRRAAVDAGVLLFGGLPVTFPVTVAIVNSYGDAK